MSEDELPVITAREARNDTRKRAREDEDAAKAYYREEFAPLFNTAVTNASNELHTHIWMATPRFQDYVTGELRIAGYKCKRSSRNKQAGLIISWLGPDAEEGDGNSSVH